MQGVASLPGFYESVRILLHDEAYALYDVGMMFGVSRERIRQLCERAGIGRMGGAGLGSARIWNDTENRFVPIGKGELTKQVGANDRQLRRRVKLGYRAHAVTALQALAKRHNRPVTLSEMWEAVSGERIRPENAVSRLRIVFGLYGGVKDSMDRIRQEAGLQAMPVGHSIRPKGGTLMKGKEHHPERNERIRKARAEGRSIRWIAARWMLRESAVYRILAKPLPHSRQPP